MNTYKAKELAGSVGKDSRRHQEEHRGGGRGHKRKDSQGQQKENPAHIFAVSRQREGFKDTSWDPKSSLVSLQICKSLLVLSQHRSPFRGVREILDSSPVVKGAC